MAVPGPSPPTSWNAHKVSRRTKTDPPGNPRFRRTYATAKAAGVDVEVVPCTMDGSWKTKEFLEKFPLGYLPAFEGADGFKLQESGAIADYRECATIERPMRGERERAGRGVRGRKPAVRPLSTRIQTFLPFHDETLSSVIPVLTYTCRQNFAGGTAYL